MTERDKILKTLRDVPGVVEDPSYGSPGSEYLIFRTAEYTRNLIVYEHEMRLCINDATLAEAVAALTPPAEPRKPTYDYVAGLKGVKAKKRAEYILFERQDGTSVEFSFGADGAMLSAYFDELDIATPTTEDEVLATLRMCRVEVEG